MAGSPYGGDGGVAGTVSVLVGVREVVEGRRTRRKRGLHLLQESYTTTTMTVRILIKVLQYQDQAALMHPCPNKASTPTLAFALARDDSYDIHAAAAAEHAGAFRDKVTSVSLHSMLRRCRASVQCISTWFTWPGCFLVVESFVTLALGMDEVRGRKEEGIHENKSRVRFCKHTAWASQFLR